MAGKVRFIPRDDATQAVLDELREYFGVRTDEQVMEGAIALAHLAKRFAPEGTLKIADGDRVVNIDLWSERRKPPESAYNAVAEAVKAVVPNNVVPFDKDFSKGVDV